MLEVEICDDLAALQSVEEEWRSLWRNSSNPIVFLHPLWTRCWWTYYGESYRLKVLLVRTRGGELIGIAPMSQLAQDPHKLTWIGGKELTDYMDFVVRKGREVQALEAVGHRLKELLNLGGELALSFVREDSVALSEHNVNLKAGWDVEIRLQECSPWVHLLETWEEYLESLSSHDRHELRRKLRKAQSSLPLEFRSVRDDASWDEAMDNFIRLHRLSHPEKAAFMDHKREAFFREMASCFREEGLLRLTELRVGKTPISSAISFVWGKTWALYNSGFDPSYRQYSAGILHVAYTIREAMEEGLSEYDFLRGREAYKYSFGAKDRYLYEVRMKPRRDQERK